MKSYDHSKIEKKWQKAWDENQVYKTLPARDAIKKKIKPYYVLDMFPYPSGSGLHVGHPRGYIASDVFARMKRMQGFNVLHPMGFDSFGLPAEQYAIQTGKNPATFTEQLVQRYKTQLSILGLSYDWDRQVATHDPKYYKWTQWIFLQIYNSWYDTKKQTARPILELEKIFETKGNSAVIAWHTYQSIFTAKEWKVMNEIQQQEIMMHYRLAYEGYAEVNWCAELGTVLANDEIVEKNGKMVSERGDFPVEKKSMRQWFMRITAYGDRLLSGLETIDWSHSIKEIQKNWIGKSEGAEIEFEITANKEKYLIFDFDGVLGDTYEQTIKINMEMGNVDRDSSILKTKEYFSRKPVHARGAHEDVVSKQTEWALMFDKKMAAAQFDLFEEFIKEIAKINNTKIAIVSSGTGGYILPTIEKMNKMGIHPTHVMTYEDHHSKEEKIEHICRDWDIDVCDAYYFTDTKADVYELETICDKTKLIGCGWGFLGAESLCEVLPKNQVLVNYIDIHNLFSSLENKVSVFTTRPDTLFGVTYVVLAPEHQLVAELKSTIKNWKEVESYIETTKRKDDMARTANEKNKTGVRLDGIFATNPANGESVPVWIADYVLANYGTGAVMAVPAHDERDFAFAKKYDLPINQVIIPYTGDTSPADKSRNVVKALIQKDDKIYLVRDSGPNDILYWALPGGSYEEDEDDITALSREINEETPFRDIKIGEYIGGARHFYIHRTGTKISRLTKVFHTTFKEEDKDAIPEVPGEWFSVEKAIALLLEDGVISEGNILKDYFSNKIYIEDGILINSGEFNELYSSEAKKKITEFVNGKWVTKYKFRDAIFARQRYWGEPIPLVHESLEKKYPKAFEIPFYNRFPFDLVKTKEKTIETRSLDKPGRDKVKVGDVVKLKHLPTKEVVFARITGSWKFKTIRQMWDKNPELIKEIRPEANIQSYEELYKFYKNVDKDYQKRCDTYGLVAWRLEVLEGSAIKIVSEKQLPLELPKVKSYAPAGTGESPLATVKSWVTAGYETNTMPGWAGSSWYFMRYTDPKNKKKFADDTELDYWFGKNGGVNMYVGGAEHSTGHLLYSRFWHKVLHDLGHVKSEEPFMKLRNQGMIGGADGRKMSKRWGNVVNPDDVVKQFGADTLRVYETFVGPFESDLPWSTDGIVGSRRFVERIWRFQEKVSDAKTPIELQKSLHKTIKKVSDDITTFSFNTAVSAMMIFANELEKHESINVKDFKKFLQILAPFAPYMTDELWNTFSEKGTIHHAPWPKFDPKLIIDDTVTIGIQINGKVRAEITISRDINQSELEEKVYAISDVVKWIDGKPVKKFIYVPGRIINIVI